MRFCPLLLLHHTSTQVNPRKSVSFQCSCISDMSLLENVAEKVGVSFPDIHPQGKKVYKT